MVVGKISVFRLKNGDNGKGHGFRTEERTNKPPTNAAMMSRMSFNAEVKNVDTNEMAKIQENPIDPSQCCCY